MSVLLLTNPFAHQQSHPPAEMTVSTGPGVSPGQSAGPHAVHPSQQSNVYNRGDSATSYRGSGAGAGGTAARAPVHFASNLTRAPDADRTSVVNAQTADRSEFPETDDAAPTLTIAPVPELPDPLPTSPFLKPSGS
ncbi:MAG: hypothetical protein ABJL67_22610 [Sulfitobacter sp.]